jgi:Raf kinase inhibitor-like YbhB/YbcL family protein
MKRFAVILAVLLTSAAAAEAAGLRLASPDLAAGQFAPSFIYDQSGCTGGNHSPALAWSDPPAGTKSFALTVFDPDAPTGHGWWHWVVYDIPASLRALQQDAGAGSGQNLPQGARQTANDFGGPGYGGPCPPPGSPHRYVFTLYALDAASIGAGGGPAEVAAGLKPHALAEASFTVSYGR